ncbi:MAG: ornithine cyclodeaminase family protein [Anaerolineae bacterium]|nr:ornithine cyclodeaminase family protein [Anaerolineae bacterium]
MLILTAADLRAALPMDQTIAAMKTAFAALSAGRAEVPLRSRLPVDAHQGVSLFMPAFLTGDDDDALAIKIVSVFSENAKLNLPIIHAAVVVLEAHTGRIIAMLEGAALTAIRTGAGAGAATDLLARSDCHSAAVFGAGVQARTQLEAVCSVRPIQTAWVYDPNQRQVENFIAEMAGQGAIPSDLRAAANPTEAVAQADIICTATTASTPVFDDKDLKPGVHINAVGSYTPEMQEVPAATVQRALVTVDSRQSVLAETGDLIQPIQQGLFSASHIHAEIGELVLGKQSGRSSADQITYFKSCGVAVQDAMAGRLAIKNAALLGLGQQVAW